MYVSLRVKKLKAIVIKSYCKVSKDLNEFFELTFSVIT